MAAETFDQVMTIELTYEGGKVDDPRDPGGRTNQGVTQRVYSAWLKSQGKPARDVYDMKADERDAIYRAQYADRVHFDELPSGVDLVVMDGAVNSGVAQSLKWLQRALGVPADGAWGVATKGALEGYGDYDNLIAAILAQREKFLRALSTFKTYGKGWMRRLVNLKAIGQAWATGSVGQAPAAVGVMDLGGHRKAMLSDAKAAPSRAPADALASGGVVTTGISTVQTYLQPLQGSATVDHIIAGLAVAAAIAGIAGFLWGMWARRRKAELDDALNITPVAVANDNAPTPAVPLKEAA